MFAKIFQRTLVVQCSHLSQCHNNVRIRRRRPLAQTHMYKKFHIVKKTGLKFVTTKFVCIKNYAVLSLAKVVEIYAFFVCVKCWSKILVMLNFYQTRPKPAYGRQGLDWDCWARIQFSQVKMLRDRRGAPTDLL